MLGATIGFAALLVAVGFGLGTAFREVAGIHQALRLAGAAFLCYLAWKLWQADGTATEGSIAAPPAFWEGVAAQWVNPKAWIVAIAGIAAYAVPGELYTASVIAMGAIFLVVCFPSVGAWAVIGAAARNLLRSPPAIRRFNRSMALLLLASVGTLFV